MSVNGLYDSDIGDSLARRMLNAASKTWHKKQRVQAKGHSKHVCICGNFVNKVPKIRNNEKVCDACARTTAAKHGGRVTQTECSVCHTKKARHGLVIRKGKLCCKKCADKK